MDRECVHKRLENYQFSRKLVLDMRIRFDWLSVSGCFVLLSEWVAHPMVHVFKIACSASQRIWLEEAARPQFLIFGEWFVAPTAGHRLTIHHVLAIRSTSHANRVTQTEKSPQKWIIMKVPVVSTFYFLSDLVILTVAYIIHKHWRCTTGFTWNWLSVDKRQILILSSEGLVRLWGHFDWITHWPLAPSFMSIKCHLAPAGHWALFNAFKAKRL